MSVRVTLEDNEAKAVMGIIQMTRDSISLVHAGDPELTEFVERNVCVQLDKIIAKFNSAEPIPDSVE